MYYMTLFRGADLTQSPLLVYFYISFVSVSLHLMICLLVVLWCSLFVPKSLFIWKGYYVRKHCTEYTSTTCAPCPSSTFSAAASGLTSCLSCTVCDVGKDSQQQRIFNYFSMAKVAEVYLSFIMSIRQNKLGI